MIPVNYNEYQSNINMDMFWVHEKAAKTHIPAKIKLETKVPTIVRIKKDDTWKKPSEYASSEHKTLQKQKTLTLRLT